MKLMTTALITQNQIRSYDKCTETIDYQSVIHTETESDAALLGLTESHDNTYR